MQGYYSVLQSQLDTSIYIYVLPNPNLKPNPNP